MNPSKPLRIIVAGGGTGGHLFPGIAVAEAYKEKEPQAEILFVGSRKPFEKKAVEAAGFEHRSIAVEGLKGRGILGKVKSLILLMFSVLTALALVMRFRPVLVLGVGGYASAPCVIAAWMLGVKTAVQEQNLAPGMTNRFLGCLAGRVYVSFAGTVDHFDDSKVRVFGNPVRKSLLQEPSREEADPARDPRIFNVLVLGGSQGAHGINKAVIEALSRLRSRQKYSFVHQTGDADFTETERAYKFWGGQAVVQPFFHDMGKRYSDADLVVCRAGASTVAELTAAGKAAVFVPFPHAADNHQEQNARALEQAGAAQVILEGDLSGSVMGDIIAYYEQNREQLSTMGRAAKSLGKPHAANDIAEDTLVWATRKNKGQQARG